MAMMSYFKKMSEPISVGINSALKIKERPEVTLGILGGMQGVLVFIISTILHYSAEPFTFASHWVSNMGIGPNGAAFVFNYGLMLSATLMFLFISVLSKKLWQVKRKGVRTLTIIGLLNGISAVVGIFLLTFNPMNGIIELHALGAYMYFTNSIIYFTVTTYALHKSGISSKKHWIMTVILLVLNIANIPAQFITIKYFLHPDIPLSDLTFAHFMNVLSSMDPVLGVVRVLEWSILIGFFVWVICTGFMLANSEKMAELSQSKA